MHAHKDTDVPVYRIMASAMLDPNEDRIEVIKDGQVMGLQARVTYAQAVKVARGGVPDWKQFVFGFFGRNLRAEAEAQVHPFQFGYMDAGVNLILDTDEIREVRAQVRRIQNDVVSYRDVEITSIELSR